MLAITMLWNGISLALSAISYANDIQDFVDRIEKKKIKYKNLSVDLYLEFQAAEYEAKQQFDSYIQSLPNYDKSLYSEIIQECSLYSFKRTDEEHIHTLLNFTTQKELYSTVAPSFNDISPLINNLKEKYASNDIVMNWVRIYEGIFCNILLLPKYGLLHEWYQFSLINLSYEKLTEIDRYINNISSSIDTINTEITQIDKKLDKSSFDILQKLSNILNVISLWITLSLFGSSIVFLYIFFYNKDYSIEHILMICICLLITDPLLYKAREPMNVYFQKKQHSFSTLSQRLFVSIILIIVHVGLCIILQNIFAYYFYTSIMSIDIISSLIPCTIIQVVRSIKESHKP